MDITKSRRKCRRFVAPNDVDDIEFEGTDVARV